MLCTCIAIFYLGNTIQGHEIALSSIYDSISYQPADSAMQTDIEQYIISREKELQIQAMINAYEQKLLHHELSYQPDGWGMIIRGLILNQTDKHYRENSPQFIKRSYDLTDYGVALLPLASTYISRLCGVESRSNMKRMILSNAGALALTVGATQLLKHSVTECRPNHEDTKSMPSGHTSIAFMSATILHREYGHISPWISVGGYATAATTQYLRLRHNSHWMNDLYIGAGIGTIATNIAYYITDRILGENGLSSKPTVRLRDMYNTLKYNVRPSSINLITGIEAGHVGGTDSIPSLTTEATYTVGAEFSYFLNTHWAVESLFRLSTTKVNNITDNLSQYHLNAGAKYSYPLLPGLRIAARCHVGGRFTEKTSTISDTSLELGSGCSFDYMDKEKYAIGISFDYYHAFSNLMKNRYLVGMVWKVML